MGDLIRGETFAAGETVTAPRLHKLVEDATLLDGSVTTSKIADGAVTSVKLAAGVSVQATQVAIPNGKILVGDGSNVGAATTVDSATLVTSPSIAVKDGGVATVKIADLAVTGAKLETLSPSPAGTYGSFSHIPVIVVDAKGRVTGVTLVAVAGTTSKAEQFLNTANIPAAGGSASFTHLLGVMPSVVQVYLEFTAAHLGRAIGDRVPIESVASATNGDDQAFTVDFNATHVIITRDVNATAPALASRSGGAMSALTLSNCGLRIVVWV